MAVSYLLGIPSAINLNILTNQDFVWGLALLLSGGIFAFVIIRFNTAKLRKTVINVNKDDLKINRIWDFVISYFIPIASVVLLLWWLINDGMNNRWYDPFASSSLMTCILQWSLILIALIALNKKIVQRIDKED